MRSNKVILEMWKPFKVFRSLSLFIAALFFLMPVIVNSQVTGSCAEKLRSAQSLFENGQVEQVPSMLEECMKSGFNREESLAAYKLLIQACLFEDRLERADSVMMAFLRKNPEYQVSPTDHSSFVHLFNSFRVKRVIQIAFHIGTNQPYLTFIDPLSTAGIPGASNYNSTAANLFAAFEAKMELGKKTEVSIEAGYSQLSFTNTEEFMGFKTIIVAETQNRLELPLSLTYNLMSFGKFTAFGRLGQGVAVNLSSSAKPSYDASDLNNPNSFSGADIDRGDSRIKLDLFTQVGAGIKYKIPRGFAFLEVRSNFGMLNQTVRGGDSAEELKWLYNYEDDDFHFNAINISLGLSQILFKPSKK
jgi:hypothetical protein